MIWNKGNFISIAAIFLLMFAVQLLANWLDDTSLAFNSGLIAICAVSATRLFIFLWTRRRSEGS